MNRVFYQIVLMMKSVLVYWSVLTNVCSVCAAAPLRPAPRRLNLLGNAATLARRFPPGCNPATLSTLIHIYNISHGLIMHSGHGVPVFTLAGHVQYLYDDS